MKKIALLIITFAMLLAGCGENPAKPVAKFDLKLAYTKSTNGLAKQSLDNSVMVSANTIMDMGAIEANKGYSFIVVNNSTDTLFDVKVTSSNPKFSPTVTVLGNIGAPTQDFYIMPLINITALNGFSESRTVRAAVMKESESSTTLTITGTFNGQPFSVSYDLKVSPKFVSPKLIATDTVQGTAYSTFVLNAESCDIHIQKIHLDNTIIDTVFHANDTIPNVFVQTFQQWSYFTCVADYETSDVKDLVSAPRLTDTRASMLQ